MCSSVLTTQANTQHREMAGVTWRDIPIMRININMKEQEQTRKQPGKRVTWNENLLDIKTISPRVKTDKFRFPAQQKPSQPSCTHFICKPGQPCRNSRSESPARNTTKLQCSPQLQKVVLHAVKQKENRAYDWTPQNNKKYHNSQQHENRTYDWTPKNNQKYHNSQLRGTFV